MVDVAQLNTTLAAAENEKPTGDWSGKPAIPASTVAATNNSGYLMWVEVVGGTVTVVSVDGVSTGRVVGAFFLRPGSTIAITYSVVPTAWHWFAL
jgi:hypothetical protein